MLKLIAIQSNGDGDEEEGDGDEEEGNEIKDHDHSIPYYCFSDLPKNTTTKENETLLAIGTAFVQGEDVAARGHVLLFSVDKNPDHSQTLVPEVYSKELKGAISALASLQGHLNGAISALASLQSLLLIASGPKISWFQRWTYGKRGKILDLGVRILNMKCRWVSSAKGHSDSITNVRFKPSSHVFATSSFDSTVQIWDSNNVYLVESSISMSTTVLYTCMR